MHINPIVYPISKCLLSSWLGTLSPTFFPNRDKNCICNDASEWGSGRVEQLVLAKDGSLSLCPRFPPEEKQRRVWGATLRVTRPSLIVSPVSSSHDIPSYVAQGLMMRCTRQYPNGLFFIPRKWKTDRWQWPSNAREQTTSYKATKLRSQSTSTSILTYQGEER
jgi:hypothetical protein